MNPGEWTLRSRRVLTPAGLRAADVVIRNEVIADLLPHDGPEAEGVILDVGDLAILPGLVVFHRETPETIGGHWFEAATRDSAAGGVTTLIDLPPGLDLESSAPSVALWRMVAAEGNIRVDCGLVVPLGRGNVERISSWVEAGFLGLEAVLGGGEGGSTLASSEADLRAAMPILAESGRPLFVDSARIGHRAGPGTRPLRFSAALPEREFAAIRLLIRLCRETRCRVHLIQPSASEALPMLAEARAEGLPFHVLTCPGHLGLGPEELASGLPTFPVESRHRGPDDRGRLWDGLEAGLIDGIGPDLGTPAIRPSVRLGLDEDEAIPVGAIRRTLPTVWAEARRRGYSLSHLARWLATKPADLVGLANRKGSIAPGLDADFVVFDPDAQPSPEPGSAFASGYDGSESLGVIAATILRGSMIFQGGRFVEHPRGSVVLRIEETQPIPGTKN